jgi:uncharacterized protein (UPF0335 family)
MAGIHFDTGIKEFNINGRAVLRFNPTDPGLFQRILNFQAVAESFEKRYAALDKEMTGEVNENGFPAGAEKVVMAVKELDAEIKESLRDIFGRDNDFDAIFDGMSCLAMTDTGANIVSNFMEAVVPLIEGTAEERAEITEKVQAARKKAAANRAQRRAAAKGDKGAGR